MNRKIRIKFSRDTKTATYLLRISEDGRVEGVQVRGDSSDFIRGDGSAIDFINIHTDGLMQAVKDQAEQSGAEYTFDDVTGNREFHIKLTKDSFNAEYLVNYREGNPIPLVTTPLNERAMPLPDGSSIPFDKVGAADLQSFIASMAKTNGLNFEFTDLHD